MNKTNTPQQALEKIKHYCAYQERCHFEVKLKLKQLGLNRSDADAIISVLIEENYLNEERFSTSFARGKFHQNKWGKVKIQYELKQRKISAYCINKALNAIDPIEYEEMLKSLLATKWNSLSGGFQEERIQKTFNYLLQKGYEAALIQPLLKELKP